MDRILGLVRRFRGNDRGIVAVFVVLMLPVLIGGLALAVDVGFWYVIKRNAQNAADAAAIAGAGLYTLHREHLRRRRTPK